jgi:DNA repair protein RadA/Sms
MIDSIQTMWADTVDSAPGSVSQVRASAHELTTFAKRRGVAVMLVGHVTKEGQIAGPRVVEHMVDTVLYFEGERGHQFRILRAVKNRFGPADEIGVFEMTGRGAGRGVEPLRAVPERPRHARARFRRVRGHRGDAARARGDSRRWWRPLRSAAAPRGGGLGRRAAGDDPRRAGGALRHLLRQGSTSISTWRAACASPSPPPISPWPPRSCRRERTRPCPARPSFSASSLSGAVRPVTQAENRLKEAAKLGFRRNPAQRV